MTLRPIRWDEDSSLPGHAVAGARSGTHGCAHRRNARGWDLDARRDDVGAGGVAHEGSSVGPAHEPKARNAHGDVPAAPEPFFHNVIEVVPYLLGRAAEELGETLLDLLRLGSQGHGGTIVGRRADGLPETQRPDS